MKTLKTNILVILAITLLFAGCKEDEPELYSGAPFFHFPMDENNDNIYAQQYFQNFHYLEDESITRDTIYIAVTAMAAIPTTDARIQLEAFESDTLSHPERILGTAINAASGEQYVPFDSPELDDLLTFHAGQMSDTIGIVLLREPSMKNQTYKLTFRIKSSDEALVADGANNRVVVYTTDRVTRPSNWNLLGYEYGAYGDVKLDFMIRHSDLNWDEAAVKMVATDEFLRIYYVDKFRKELVIENNELGADGPLREADGTFVAF